MNELSFRGQVEIEIALTVVPQSSVSDEGGLSTVGDATSEDAKSKKER